MSTFRKSTQKARWIWRTLFGYTVVFVNPDYEHYVKHRPFRQPIMKSTRLTKQTLRGKSYDMLVYDELSMHPWIAGEVGLQDPTHTKESHTKSIGEN